MTKLDGTSFDIKQNQIEQLKQIFPEVVTEGKIDREKLLLTLGADAVISGERYVLNWAGKTDAYRAVQTQTTATLKPQRDQSVDFDTTQNIFIEGENLEALKVLQKSYYGKVKMIYIDPPYNTGNDSFIYPDKFSETKDEYLRRIGDKDEAGYLTKEGFFRKNSRESGQFHSNWLSMMYPRLFLARNLLHDDGVFFISVDDNEVHNLRMIMNEIFGEEKFIGQFIWKSRQNKDNRNVTGASIDHEYVLCYGKKVRGSNRKIDQYKNPDNDLRGPWTSGNMVGLLPEDQRPNCHYDLIDPKTGINYGKPKLGWRYDRNTMNKLIREGRILWPPTSSGRPRKKVFLSELNQTFTGYSSIIGLDIYTRNGTMEIEELFGIRVMEFPKPSELLKELILQGCEEDGIILDYFSGSSTTAQAVMELNKEDGGNRKFIMIQLPEKTDENSEAFKAGYKSIADIGKERIRRVSKKIKKEQQENPELFDDKQPDLGFKSFILEPSNFKIWRTDTIETEEDLKKQMEAFVDPVRPDAEIDNMAWEILINSGYELTTPLERAKIADTPVYSIAENEQILLLESLSQEAIDEIIKRKPGRVVCLDRLFNGNDQLKTNTVLQMKDAGVEFRTV
jgi:adenine-specific DNA-methyltransferase